MVANRDRVDAALRLISPFGLLSRRSKVIVRSSRAAISWWSTGTCRESESATLSAYNILIKVSYALAMASAAPQDRSGRQGVILVAIDGSTTSLRAEAWAANLARKQGCRLLCLFVETHPAYADVALWTGAALPLDFGFGELTKEIIEGIRNDLRTHPVDADFLVRSGDPATEIERVAEEFKVDAVVVGTSMQARHRLMGSVAVRLVHDGRWPVAVVP